MSHFDRESLPFHLSPLHQISVTQKRAKKEENPYAGLEDDEDDDEEEEEEDDGVMQYVVSGRGSMTAGTAAAPLQS
jgi:hypothetical protein